jgi:hypothetical protein
MTLIIEDLLLGRRQFAPEIERFIEDEIQRTAKSRNQIIEAALSAAINSKRIQSAADSKIQRAREVVAPKRQVTQPARKSRQG